MSGCGFRTEAAPGTPPQVGRARRLEPLRCGARGLTPTRSAHGSLRRHGFGARSMGMSERADRCDYTEPLLAGEPASQIDPRLLRADSVTLWTTAVK